MHFLGARLAFIEVLQLTPLLLHLFYEIEALVKHLLAKFGTKYYVGTVVAANLGKESSTTCTEGRPQ